MLFFSSLPLCGVKYARQRSRHLHTLAEAWKGQRSSPVISPCAWIWYRPALQLQLTPEEPQSRNEPEMAAHQHAPDLEKERKKGLPFPSTLPKLVLGRGRRFFFDGSNIMNNVSLPRHSWITTPVSFWYHLLLFHPHRQEPLAPISTSHTWLIRHNEDPVFKHTYWKWRSWRDKLWVRAGSQGTTVVFLALS